MAQAPFFKSSSKAASDITASDIVGIAGELESLKGTIAPLASKEPYKTATEILGACSQSIFNALEKPETQVKPVNPGPTRS